MEAAFASHRDDSLPRFLATNLLAAEKQAVQAKDYANAETLKSAKEEIDQLLQEQEAKRGAEAEAVQARDYAQAAEIAKELEALDERMTRRTVEYVTSLEPLLSKALESEAMTREGYDKLTLSNGDMYEGQFKSGKYHGQGTYTSKGGTVYVGEFAHGDFSGHGKKTGPDGVVYEGQFKNDQFHGHGTYKASGNVYVGEFRNGNFNGQGKMTHHNGYVYEGQFKDDNFHGHGSYTKADGNGVEADFSHGQIIETTARPIRRGGGRSSTNNTSTTGLRAPLIANQYMERGQGGDLLSQLRDDPYRASFPLNISAAVDECCGCGSEGELSEYDPRDWRGRLSAAEYASLQHRVRENYCGHKCTHGCCCCCLTTDLETYLQELNTELLPRGVKISIAARHSTNGTNDAWRLVVVIVPI